MKLSVLAAAALAAPWPAHAQQWLDVRDGARVEAIIATREATRIRMAEGPITDVFGNIYANHCPPPGPAVAGATALPPPATPTVLHADGELVLDCDRARGELFVQPVGAGTKPINLFIASRTGTYTLLLRRADVPADTLVLRDTGAAASDRVRRDAPTLSRRTLKTLLAAMVTGRAPADMRSAAHAQTVPLWQDTRFVLRRTHHWRGLTGETYALTNLGATPLALAETDFDAPGRAIVAIALEQPTLAAGATRAVYVVRRTEAP